MNPYYERDGIAIYVGNVLDVTAHIERGTVDAVITDPPYGLNFMGREWDDSVPGPLFWENLSRIMKPGAHLLSFGGTRTFHRMAVAIEDAGLEIRDTLMWLYGSGFPKSLDVSKAIESDLTKGKSNSRSLRATEQAGDGESYTLRGKNNGIMGEAREYDRKEFTPTTPEAEAWQGWGTALKPAYEPIIMARKRMKRTVAKNVLKHGTGALNIDACRIEGAPPSRAQPIFNSPTGQVYNFQTGTGRNGKMSHATGRWPANVVLDEDAAEELDAQSGERHGGGNRDGRGRRTQREGQYQGNAYGVFTHKTGSPNYADTGGASRFFYVAKASRRERNAGLEGMPERTLRWSSGEQSPGTFQSEGTNRSAANHHPTVKPITLMEWLIRLVTRPGGLIVDPFGGSFTTLVAAARLGYPAIGMDLSEEYAEIGARRVEYWLDQRAAGYQPPLFPSTT